ncbi:MAG: response regulator transcription factor [Deltaproteobacteria bacterium]|nr:response regulator transcription factor [Deltaproteobacteria bacterium]
MKAKILFFDDIFSDLFRAHHDQEQLVWDDNWVAALETEFTDPKRSIGITFELVKSGDIQSWRELIEKERPDILLIDLFWPEEARKKFNDERRGEEISLGIISQIRKEFPSLPVISYTFKPNQEILEQAYDAGATLFLEKVALALPEVHSSLKYFCIYLLRQRQAANDHEPCVADF